MCRRKNAVASLPSLWRGFDMPAEDRSPFWFALVYWIFLGFLTMFGGHSSPWLLPFFSGVFTPFLGLMVPNISSHQWSFAGLLLVYIAAFLFSLSLTLEVRPGYISYASVEKPQLIAVYIGLFSVPAVVFIAILARSFLRKKQA